jgi:hypothetical protein
VEAGLVQNFITKKDYAVMMLFLSLCGNVFVNSITSYAYVLVAFYFLYEYISDPKVKSLVTPSLKSGVITIISCFIVLFVLQYFVFDWNTVPGLINHISKFIVGAGFVAFFGARFRFILFKTMYVLCFISLPLWLYQFVTGSGAGGFDWALGKTIIVYCYRASADIVRNCGFFWEPGAMGGYIAFTFLLFLYDFGNLLKSYKKECVVLFLTLLSTQSSAAYIDFGLFVIVYVMFSMKSKAKFWLLPVVVVSALYVYNSAEFLSEKISRQNEIASKMTIGEFSSTRAGTIMFDLHYIQKHPLIGNGLHERTRLADHGFIQKMLKSGDMAAMGNGLSDQLAKWGLVYFFVFCLVFFKTNRALPLDKKIYFLALVAVILQGECFFNYPLFLSIPLICVKDGDSL